MTMSAVVPASFVNLPVMSGRASDTPRLVDSFFKFKPSLIFSGQRFGRWTVLFRHEERQRLWMCECDCGTMRPVRAGNLRRKSTSCGCFHREQRSVRFTTHGHSIGGRSPEYQTWKGIRRRCFNPKGKDFPNYGGRGITVCDRWRDSFEAFLADMGEKPAGLTIERKDNDGNYEPSNCKWATRLEQRHNQRPRKPPKPYMTRKRIAGLQRERGLH